MSDIIKDLRLDEILLLKQRIAELEAHLRGKS